MGCFVRMKILIAPPASCSFFVFDISNLHADKPVFNGVIILKNRFCKEFSDFKGDSAISVIQSDSHVSVWFEQSEDIFKPLVGIPGVMEYPHTEHIIKFSPDSINLFSIEKVNFF